MSLRSRAGTLAVLPLLSLAAACGSTVQLSEQRTVAAGGLADLGTTPQDLGGPAPTGPTAAPVTGVTARPGSAPTTGTAAQPPSAAVPTYPSVPTTGTQPAGTADTSPITLGVLDIGSGTPQAASSFGVSGSLTPQQTVRAMVDWYNLHGGIARRRIKLVEYTASATAASYETEFAAACAKFTQDNHVAAVLTYTGYQISDSYETCLSKAGVPNISGVTGGYDASTMARHPLLFTTAVASVDRAVTAELRALTGNGFLTKQNKIGVLVESCPSNTLAYDHTFAPLAAQLGLQVMRRDIDCVQGNNNMAQVIAQVDAAVLPFRSAGVDRVTFVSNYQGAATVFFEQQAASQGYKPKYALTSYSTLGAYAGDVSADAQTRIAAVGWAPDADITTPPAPAGATKRCRDAFATMQVKPSNTADGLALDLTCSLFFALEDALKATGGHGDAASLRRGLESAGESPYLLGGRRLTSAARHDSPELFATIGYKPACSCFVYTGAPKAWAG